MSYPTPETNQFYFCPNGTFKMLTLLNCAKHARSLEQRLAVAVEALENSRATFEDFNNALRLFDKSIMADAAVVAREAIGRTLAAIKEKMP